MIMERAQALTHLITRFPDIVLITTYRWPVPVFTLLGIPFPWVDQAVGTSSTPGLARLQTSIPGM